MDNGLLLANAGQIWLPSLIALAAAITVGWLFYWVVFAVIDRFARDGLASITGAVTHNFRAPARWLFPLLGILAVLPDMPISARKIRTQFQVLRRIGAVLITVLAVGVMLMTFPDIRAIGATLFASAGAAGIIVGLAARPVLSNWLAGIQIALAQPIRIEDSVVVEGEWGWIEEITTTYVVVRIWDLRRLVLPLSYFIEHPFQNWTRTTANLLGTSFIYADYTVPVQAVRGELHRVLQEDELWDGFAWSLDVTNLTEHVVEMRAMVSAANAGNTVNLRRHVREKLVTFLQKEYPQCLPRTRVAFEAGATESDQVASERPARPG